MSRTRIVKGNITKIIGGNYKRYSNDEIVNSGSKVIQIGDEEGVSYGVAEAMPVLTISKLEGGWFVNKGTYRWDDRITSQALAVKHHGENAKYIGVKKTVSTKRNGKIVDSVTLNDDGTLTSGAKTLGVNSDIQFKNQHGSVFISRQTKGSFVSIGVDGALIGGFGFQGGIVTDAVGNTKFFTTFNANIGIGGGASLGGGVITPTGSNQFLTSEFEGNSSEYSAEISVPFISASYSEGGSIDSDLHATDKMDPSKFGDSDRGYKTKQGSGGKGLGKGGGIRAGAMFSYGTTEVLFE